MRAWMDISYLTKNKQGIWQYRRRVPGDLVEAFGKAEIIVSLKTRDTALAIKRHADEHERVERALALSAAKSPDQRRYDDTRQRLQEAGLMPLTASTYPPPTFDSEAFHALTEATLRAADSRTAKQLSAPLSLDSPVMRLVAAQHRGLEPLPLTWGMAVAGYLRAMENRPTYRTNAQGVERVTAVLIAATGKPDPAIASLTRHDAVATRDALLAAGSAPGTVNRRINTLKAVMNHAIREHGLRDVRNQFDGLRVKDPSDPRDRRDALTPAEIVKAGAVLARSNADARDIWAVLALTGARVTEIAGLTWDDVALNAAIPHIVIRNREGRTIKGPSSRRTVPLVGAALAVFLARASEGGLKGPVFTRYARRRDTASAVLVKAMQAAGVHVKTLKVPHSLRHSHKEWLRRVAPEDITDRIHGHSGPGVARLYGSDDMLDRQAEAIAAAVQRAGLDQRAAFPWLDL